MWTVVPLLPVGVGIALNFTLLEASETWLQTLVAIMALGASFLVGWFSPRLRKAMLLPIVVLACLSAAFAVYGVGSSDIDPIVFTIFLSVIYGGLASVIFAAGWMAHRVVIASSIRSAPAAVRRLFRLQIAHVYHSGRRGKRHWCRCGRREAQQKYFPHVVTDERECSTVESTETEESRPSFRAYFFISAMCSALHCRNGTEGTGRRPSARRLTQARPTRYLVQRRIRDVHGPSSGSPAVRAVLLDNI